VIEIPLIKYRHPAAPTGPCNEKERQGGVASRSEPLGLLGIRGSLAVGAVLALSACGGGGGGDGGGGGGGGNDVIGGSTESLLSASTGDRQVTLRWTRPYEPLLGDMEVCKALDEIQFDAGTGCPSGSIEIGSSADLTFDQATGRYTFIDTDVFNDTVYFYRVRFSQADQEAVISNLAFVAPREEWTRTAGIVPFNDTGITSGPMIPAGHDHTHGRDHVRPLKQGFGVAGFDFTKIANSSLDLAEAAGLGIQAQEWSCTRDNVTGLMWEIRPNQPGHLRDRSHRYHWYNSDGAANGGAAGSRGGAACGGTLPACNTEAYVDRVNAIGLCGYTDWRLPTADELLSKAHFGGSDPTVDQQAFPDVPLTGQGFWSGTPNAAASNSAWLVSMRLPVADRFAEKSTDLHVRLVRGEPTRAIDTASGETRPGCRADIHPTAALGSAFVLVDGVPDGYACQPETGLLWRRCALGQNWTGDGCAQNANTVGWERALTDAAAFGETWSDWRLPNVKELLSITERRCVSPAVDTRVFRDLPPGTLWSSSAIWGIEPNGSAGDPNIGSAFVVRDAPEICTGW
jgi:hypothetical protein